MRKRFALCNVSMRWQRVIVKSAEAIMGVVVAREMKRVAHPETRGHLRVM